MSKDKAAEMQKPTGATEQQLDLSKTANQESSTSKGMTDISQLLKDNKELKPSYDKLIASIQKETEKRVKKIYEDKMKAIEKRNSDLSQIYSANTENKAGGVIREEVDIEGLSSDQIREHKMREVKMPIKVLINDIRQNRNTANSNVVKYNFIMGSIYSSRGAAPLNVPVIMTIGIYFHLVKKLETVVVSEAPTPSPDLIIIDRNKWLKRKEKPQFAINILEQPPEPIRYLNIPVGA